MTNHPILDAFGTMWKRIVAALNNKADKTYVETYVEKYVAENAVGGGGAIINSGTELPETGTDGEVFLKTSMVGEEYTETLTSVQGNSYGEPYTIALTYPAASIVSVNITSGNDQVYGLSWSVFAGDLVLSASDWYSPVDLEITYIVGKGADSNTYETFTATTTTSNDKTCNWQCHKHSDGRMECWGTTSAFLSGTSGTSFSSPGTLPSVPFPVTFKDYGSTQVVATCSSYDNSHLHYCWLMYPANTTTNTGDGAYIGSADGELAWINLYVTGYWK